MRTDIFRIHEYEWLNAELQIVIVKVICYTNYSPFPFHISSSVPIALSGLNPIVSMPSC
jgi:hypothetical protein